MSEVALAVKLFESERTVKNPNKKLKRHSRKVKSPKVKQNLSPINNTNDQKECGKKLEVLYDGYYYDVTEFIARHPGGDVIKLYAESGEDATIPIQQFHYRSWKLVLARMKSLRRRAATPHENVLNSKTKRRHDKLTKDYHALASQLEAEGFFEPNVPKFILRILQCVLFFSCGLAISILSSESSLIWRAVGVILMTLSAGQSLYLIHEGGHNSFTGNPKIDKIFQAVCYGIAFGLSASSWNYTHSEHHAMPQHETKDADLKTLPLLAFNKRLVKGPQKTNKLLQYQHILFVLCDTCIVTLSWKLNHHIKFAWRNSCWLDLLCMLGHYGAIPLLGFVEWMLITWLGSIYVLGNLVMSHTHLPIVEQGKKLHWVEYAFQHTTNIRSSWWVDWWTGHLNYQIEHHLFPTMPEYKNKLCRDRVKALAKKHKLPYHLCSYWQAVKSTYNNLENVAHEIRHM